MTFFSRPPERVSRPSVTQSFYCLEVGMFPRPKPRPKTRILFVIKQGALYGTNHPYHVASGLLNSAKFVVDMLNASGKIEAKLSVVIDNNDIDREVFNFKPSVVIVEAYWVVPDKFDILTAPHPTVKWIVRAHSDFPFLATEGVALQWTKEYLTKPNVLVAFNSPHVVRDLKDLECDWHIKSNILYLPNFYPLGNFKRGKHPRNEVHIGCFGAIRPLKNQLLQAVAAIRFADAYGKKLRLYVNSTRCEQGGEGVLKNILALFEGTRHELVEIGWLNHKDFLVVMQNMDFSMCVSFSETFCITAADAVSCNVPLVCSDQIPWATPRSIVPTTDTDPIVQKLKNFSDIRGAIVNALNRRSLASYSDNSRKLWLKQFAS